MSFSELWLRSVSVSALYDQVQVPYYLQFGFNGVYLAMFIYDKSTRPTRVRVKEGASFYEHSNNKPLKDQGSEGNEIRNKSCVFQEKISCPSRPIRIRGSMKDRAEED